MTERQLAGRVTPCASCPYRKNVPSGLWDASEYEKLPRYDEETFAQPTRLFACHQQDETLCAGWLGHGDPARLLALRIGVSAGDVDPSCFDYSTDVELFESGADAAEHGLAGVDQPDIEAQIAIKKLAQTAELRARPSTSES